MFSCGLLGGIEQTHSSEADNNYIISTALWNFPELKLFLTLVLNSEYHYLF